MDTANRIISKLDSIRDLPTLPIVAQKVAETARDVKADARRLAKVIEDDPAIMARLLKVVNSPLYAGNEPITSVQHAVARMGMRTVSNLAMTTSVFSAFGKTETDTFSREAFWRHSISVGIAAVVIRQKVGPVAAGLDREGMRLAGLLHDIGKILLDQYFHEDFSNALAQARVDNIPLVEAERKIMGTDHSQVGAWLGVKWKLNEDLMSVIRRHHSPEQTTGKQIPLVYICHVANFICNQQKLGNGGDTEFPPYEQNVWSKIGLTLDDIPSIVGLIDEESRKSEILMAFAKE